MVERATLFCQDAGKDMYNEHKSGHQRLHWDLKTGK
jgi:hypothetical protein